MFANIELQLQELSDDFQRGSTHNFEDLINNLQQCAIKLMTYHKENSIMYDTHEELNRLFRPVLDFVKELTRKFLESQIAPGDYLDDISTIAELMEIITEESKQDFNTGSCRRPKLLELYKSLESSNLPEIFRAFFPQPAAEDLIWGLLTCKADIENNTSILDGSSEDGEEEQFLIANHASQVPPLRNLDLLFDQKSIATRVIESWNPLYKNSKMKDIMDSWRYGNLVQLDSQTEGHLRSACVTALRFLCKHSFWANLKAKVHQAFTHKSLVFTQQGELLHTSPDHSICRKYKHFYMIASRVTITVWDSESKIK